MAQEYADEHRLIRYRGGQAVEDVVLRQQSAQMAPPVVQTVRVPVGRPPQQLQQSAGHRLISHSPVDG